MGRIKLLGLPLLISIIVFGFAWKPAEAAVPGTNERVSVDSSGTQSNNGSGYPTVSKDGRYVAFTSGASNLVSGDTNGIGDVFVRDRTNNTVTRVSVSSSGTQSNGGSQEARISSDGRFVVFSSIATNLVSSGSSNIYFDTYIHDMQTGATELVNSPFASGTAADANSGHPDVSRDGRYVVFDSNATNLVSGDTNSQQDIFVKDRTLGTIKRLSVSSGGSQGNGDSYEPRISDDGAYVVFTSLASNLVSSDTNAKADIFLDNRIGGDSLTDITISANNSSARPSLSYGGKYISFDSLASNLVSGDTNSKLDTFVYTLDSSTFERESISTSGTEGNDDSISSSISLDGRYIVYQSAATNLVSGDTNTTTDIFLRDRQSSTTERISVDSTLVQGNGYSSAPMISADGKKVIFVSDATNLISGDTNSRSDIFLSDTGATACIF